MKNLLYCKRLAFCVIFFELINSAATAQTTSQGYQAQIVPSVPTEDWPLSEHESQWNKVKTVDDTCWYHTKTMYKVCDSQLAKTESNKQFEEVGKSLTPQPANQIQQIAPVVIPPIVETTKIVGTPTVSAPQVSKPIDFFKLATFLGLIWLVHRTYFQSAKAPLRLVNNTATRKQKYPLRKAIVLTDEKSELDNAYDSTFKTSKYAQSSSAQPVRDVFTAKKAIRAIRENFVQNEIHHQTYSQDLPSIDSWYPTQAINIVWTKEFLKSLEWKRFEEVSVEFLKLNYPDHKIQSTNIGADGGIDLEIFDPAHQLIAVGQCKSWKKKVGVEPVRALMGVMASKNIKHGIFLTTSEFSPDANRFANENNLTLYDGHKLVAKINQLDDSSKKHIDQFATRGDFRTPTCVRCDVKMVKRSIKSGAKAGKEFWGCVNYPRCRNRMYLNLF